MARSTGVYATDNTAGKELREDLLDIITNLSPKKTPLYSGLQKSTATQSVHQWLRDDTSRATSVSASQEGDEVSFSDLTPPSRVSNYVQEIIQPYKVSQKQIDSTNAGYKDALAYQQAKALAVWKMKAEYALINGTGTSGASGVAWEMTGLRKCLTTNFVSYASGTTITETRLNDILELAWDDVEEDTFELYTSISGKREISNFTSGTTKYTDATDKRLINAVDVYESDVAKMVKLFAHRDMAATSGGIYDIVAIQPKAFAVAHLRAPEVRDYPATGPFKAGYIYGSLTLEYRQEKAGVRAVNLRKNN
jgi:hypothetical protein